MEIIFTEANIKELIRERLAEVIKGENGEERDFSTITVKFSFACIGHQKDLVAKIEI